MGGGGVRKQVSIGKVILFYYVKQNMVPKNIKTLELLQANTRLKCHGIVYNLVSFDHRVS